MKRKRTPALDIAYHSHFVETLRHAVNRVGGCAICMAIVAGGVAFTLLRSGRLGGSVLPTRTRHPWEGSRCCPLGRKRHRLAEQEDNNALMAFATAR